MLRFNSATIALLYAMLLSPIISYITFGILGLRPIDTYFKIVVVGYGMIYFLANSRNLKIPVYAYFAFIWAVYLFVWSFFNGEMERRGLFLSIFYNTSLSIFFIIVIVHNTVFSSKFISRTVKIMKITIIITALISIIQVFNSEFLNAWPLWMKNAERTWFDLDIHTQRRTSIFGFVEQNALGLSFIPLVSILIGYMIYRKSQTTLFYLLAGALVAVLSNTRYVIIGYLIITIQLILFYRIRFVGSLRYLILIALIVFSSYQIINYLGYNLEEWIENRLFKEGSIKETTRFKAIDNFLYFFPKFVVFGNGNIMDDAVVAASRAIGSSHIHVGYLSHLVAYGVFGCFFLYMFWILLLRKLFINAKKTGYWGSLFAFLMFFWSFATMSQSSIFYYGLIFALVFSKYFQSIYENSAIDSFGKQLSTHHRSYTT